MQYICLFLFPPWLARLHGKAIFPILSVQRDAPKTGLASLHSDGSFLLAADILLSFDMN